MYDTQCYLIRYIPPAAPSSSPSPYMPCCCRPNLWFLVDMDIAFVSDVSKLHFGHGITWFFSYLK